MEIYKKLKLQGIEVLLDDRKKSPGEKFSCHDLIGIPKQIILGVKSFQNNQLEIKDRKSGEKKTINIDTLSSDML